MPKNAKHKLPDELLLLGCKDKENDEHWYKKRSIGNLPCPFRMILAGGVGLGKSTVVKNVLLRADPPYDRLIIVCCDKSTKDYDELEPHLVIDKLPSVASFDNEYKNCLVIDDYRAKTPADKNLLDRLFGYVSSHKRTSIMMCVQDLFAIWTPTIQRMADIFVVWKSHDENQFRMISNRVGLKQEDIDTLFKDMKFKKKDSLMIDRTSNTPAYLRKNVFEKIKWDLEPDL